MPQIDISKALQAGYTPQQVHNFAAQNGVQLYDSGTYHPSDAYLPTNNQLPSNPRNAPLLGLISQYFPHEQVRNAYNIMMLESGGNPYGPPGDTNIIRGVGDISEKYGRAFPSYGPFQVRALPDRPSPQQLSDPRFNIEYAANLYRQRGNWADWYNNARKLGLL